MIGSIVGFKNTVTRSATVVGSATVLGLALTGIGLGAGNAAAAPGQSCLWAGAPYAAGTTIVAGGWSFACQPGATWAAGGRVSTPSTVSNPGAAGNPVGQFSPGARQPGTDYTDYCVGNQLVPGTDAIYEVAPNGAGGLFWRPAGPVSSWSPALPAAAPSFRSGGSFCNDGVLQ